jgi:phosphatidate cytidylyltransferase
MTDTPPPKPRSDLGVRTASGVVMMSVAALVIWHGGWVFTAFVVVIGLGVIWEWWGLARKIAKTPLGAAIWLAMGVSYVGFVMAVLVGLREYDAVWAVLPIALVIAVDVGAYFAGRIFGGPKIAPSISPSKTWAGLIGGSVGAVLIVFAAAEVILPNPWEIETLGAVQGGILIAIIAQAGDFFESWMKRRAGVKDSGSLIPGHGGLFDRVDGLLAVLFVGGLVMWGLG